MQWPLEPIIVCLILMLLLPTIVLGWGLALSEAPQQGGVHFLSQLLMLLTMLEISMLLVSLATTFVDQKKSYETPNVEVTGAARLYRAASVWTAGLGNTTTWQQTALERRMN